MTQADAAQKVGFLAAAKTRRRVIDRDRGFSAAESASGLPAASGISAFPGPWMGSLRVEVRVEVGVVVLSGLLWCSHEVSLTRWNIVIWRHLAVEVGGRIQMWTEG